MKKSGNGLSRRDFIKGSASALVIGMYLPMLASKNALADDHANKAEKVANAFIRIMSDNSVTVLIKHIEFGQGTYTGLATLAAEEMDADWRQIRAEHAPANVKLYANLFFGLQGTGGSTAIANSFETMRNAGASARLLMVKAAAKKWNTSENNIKVVKGVVKDKVTGKTASFGDLVEIAQSLDIQSDHKPKLKSPSEFTLIGQSLPKLDTYQKSTGRADYTLDVFKEDMVVAVVAHPPAFGAKVKTYDAKNTLAVNGVVKVTEIANGIAVFANNTFNAIKGRKALSIDWDYSDAETRSSPELFKTFKKAIKKEGLSAATSGNLNSAKAQSNHSLEIELQFPYLAHAPMEPLDAVIHHKGGQVIAWFGSQMPTTDQAAIAQVFGVKPEKVDIQTQLTGGSFGRRAQQDSGLAAEAAMVAKAFGKQVPVKLIWTREDDIQGGRYRAMSVHKLKGYIGKTNELLGWKHDIAIQSIVVNSPFEMLIKDGIDSTSVEGANNQPYALPHLDVRLHNMETGVPVLWWRSVGHTHTGYAVETFIDALFEKANTDPINGRIELLAKHPREANVLKVVAKMAENAGKTPPGRERGVAMVKSFGSYVAQIAEVSKGSNGMPKVHRVWCAVDCGLPVNPNVITAQMEGGIGYGLDAILHGEITLNDKGHVEQSNFHDYMVMRINEMPEVHVEIIKSAEPPTGVGEVAVPPIGPAVSNAWRRLTGQYVTTLPFAKGVKA